MSKIPELDLWNYKPKYVWEHFITTDKGLLVAMYSHMAEDGTFRIRYEKAVSTGDGFHSAILLYPSMEWIAVHDATDKELKYWRNLFEMHREDLVDFAKAGGFHADDT